MRDLWAFLGVRSKVFLGALKTHYKGRNMDFELHNFFQGEQYTITAKFSNHGVCMQGHGLETTFYDILSA
jgi:hypothetical protein